MKTIIRMLGLGALVVLAFTSCRKEQPVATKMVSFTATLTQPTSVTKTHVENYSLVWNDGDKIKVLNYEGVNYEFTLSAKEGNVATFSTKNQNEVDFLADIMTADYTAFYPNGVVDDEFVRLVIPASQTYVSSKNFSTDTYPMLGFNEGSNFVFQSNAGLLNVSFKAPEDETREIDKVVLSANEDIAGVMAYTLDGLSYIFEGESNVITLTCDTKQVVSGDIAKDFTFILPEGTLANGFTVDVYDGESLLGSFSTDKVNVIVAQEFTEMPVRILD